MKSKVETLSAPHPGTAPFSQAIFANGFVFTQGCIYLTDMSLYQTVNEIYASYMTAPYLAREAVCVKELPLGAKVEISMIAAKQ